VNRIERSAIVRTLASAFRFVGRYQAAALATCLCLSFVRCWKMLNTKQTMLLVLPRYLMGIVFNVLYDAGSGDESELREREKVYEFMLLG
jgi:hypothetical protein